MKIFVKYLTQVIHLLSCLAIMCTGCKFEGSKKDVFKLNPALHKIYRYSLTRTSEGYNSPLEHDTSRKYIFKTHILDTVKVDFSMERIEDADSLITYKLTFNDFVRKRPSSKITIGNVSVADMDKLKVYFTMQDSIGHYLNGRSIQVRMNDKGDVKNISGFDEMFRNIYKENSASIERSISDYISANAIKDLLNVIFSVVPGTTVNENDNWVRNIILITKAPVKISNLYILENHHDDTAHISIQSILSAEQSEGFNIYMKGKQSGKAVVSYSTGMPYIFETDSETITTTDYYYVVRKEHFILFRKS